MNIFQINTPEIIIRSYVKHMLQSPELQSSNLLSIIRSKWEKHRTFMEDSNHIDSYSVSSSILERISEEFGFCGKDKLFLMLLEMCEYGFSIDEIAKSLECDVEKLGIFFDEFNSILLHYKAISNSMVRIKKLTNNKEPKRIYKVQPTTKYDN